MNTKTKRSLTIKDEERIEQMTRETEEEEEGKKKTMRRK